MSKNEMSAGMARCIRNGACELPLIPALDTSSPKETPAPQSSSASMIEVCLVKHQCE